MALKSLGPLSETLDISELSRKLLLLFSLGGSWGDMSGNPHYPTSNYPRTSKQSVKREGTFPPLLLISYLGRFAGPAFSTF